jgi:hypothetical protein
MKKTISIITALTLSSLSAGEFQSLGHHSTSMGGVGVASAKGSMAGYFNPALLTQNKTKVEVALGVGAAVRENNIGEQLDTLEKLELTDTLDHIANNVGGTNSQIDRNNIKEAKKVLESIGANNGVAVMPTAYLSTQVNEYAIGIYGTGDVSATAHVDHDRLDLSVKGNDGKYYDYNPNTDQYSEISQATYEESSLESAIGENGTTYVDVKGLVLLEVPVSYAKAFNLDQGELSVGGSLKFMKGSTFVKRMDIDSEEDTDENLEDYKKNSSNVGLDLGLLFKPSNVKNLSVGLVARNINSPKFDTIEGGSLKADMQLRTGLLYDYSDQVELAMDLDLTSNETFIPGYDSQQLGMGINYTPASWVSFRAGLMQNLANSNEGLIYSAGFGIGVQELSLNVAAQMASKSGSYDGEDIPKFSKVNVALVSRW